MIVNRSRHPGFIFVILIQVSAANKNPQTRKILDWLNLDDDDDDDDDADDDDDDDEDDDDDDVDDDDDDDDDRIKGSNRIRGLIE